MTSDRGLHFGTFQNGIEDQPFGTDNVYGYLHVKHWIKDLEAEMTSRS